MSTAKVSIRAAARSFQRKAERAYRNQKDGELPKALRDNARTHQGPIPAGGWAAKEAKDFKQRLERADGVAPGSKADGYITAREAAFIEWKNNRGVFDDDFAAYFESKTGTNLEAADTKTVSLRDKTPSARVAAHQKAYPETQVPYERALQTAVGALFSQKEDEGTLRSILQENLPSGTFKNRNALDQFIAKLFETKGSSIKLLGHRDGGHDGDDPAKYWIFEARVAGWGSKSTPELFTITVDRKTGAAWSCVLD